MKPFYLPVLFVLLFTASCKRSTSSSPAPWDNDTLQNSTFIKEIPLRKMGRDSGKPDFLYNITHFDALRLRLDSIEDGYRVLQLRVWLGHSMAITKNVVVISRRNNQWRANIISYKEGIYKDADVKSTKVEPASGWDAFVKKIVELKVLDLPNFNDLTGYSGCGIDGIDYRFELSTTKKYRFYYYCDPEEYATKFWQAKNVLVFSDLLEKEFGFTYAK